MKRTTVGKRAALRRFKSTYQGLRRSAHSIWRSLLIAARHNFRRTR